MRQLMLSIEYFRYCTQMKVAVRCALYRILKESLTDVGSSVNKVSEYRDRFIIFQTHRQWKLQKLVFWTMWTGQLFPFLQTDSRGFANHNLLISNTLSIYIQRYLRNSVKASQFSLIYFTLNYFTL